jgi:peptidyl-prolyl cis-trans isomerase SurA
MKRVILAFIMIFTTVAEAEIIDRIVVIVNDEVITLSELEETLQLLPDLSPKTLIKKQVLEQLINEKLAAQEIKQIGIKVSEEEINGTVNRILKENNISLGVFKAKLKTQGMSYPKYRQSLKEQIEKNRLVGLEVESKITILEETLQKYYILHQKQYQGYTEFHLRHILLLLPKTQQEMEEIRKKQIEIEELLRQNLPFSEIARRYSQAPTAKEGGDLGWIKKKALSPEIRNIAQSLQVGQVSTFIKTKGGYQLIQIVEKKQVPERSFEEVRNQIYSELYRQEIERYYKRWLEGLRKKAFVKILY